MQHFQRYLKAWATHARVSADLCGVLFRLKSFRRTSGRTSHRTTLDHLVHLTHRSGMIAARFRRVAHKNDWRHRDRRMGQIYLTPFACGFVQRRILLWLGIGLMVAAIGWSLAGVIVFRPTGPRIAVLVVVPVILLAIPGTAIVTGVADFLCQIGRRGQRRDNQ